MVFYDPPGDDIVHITEALKTNKGLHKFWYVGEFHTSAILAALFSSRSLFSKSITSLGAASFGDALKQNSTLKHLQ
jgi:hypothetical protein